ncbi:MAG: heavy metal-associated domain-containing protein [Deinococcota bacterium]
MTTLAITGMTCDHCQKAVKTALEGVQGTQQVAVDLEQGRATVQGDVQPKLLVQAVQEQGYSAQLLNTEAAS